MYQYVNENVCLTVTVYDNPRLRVSLAAVTPGGNLVCSTRLGSDASESLILALEGRRSIIPHAENNPVTVETAETGVTLTIGAIPITIPRQDVTAVVNGVLGEYLTAIRAA